jgi:hypothetical protein
MCRLRFGARGADKLQSSRLSSPSQVDNGGSARITAPCNLWDSTIGDRWRTRCPPYRSWRRTSARRSRASSPPSKRLFATLADAGPAHPAHEREFYGDGFNAARCALIDQEFDKIHSEALEHAKAYDECTKALQEAAPSFALPSSSLVRAWCIARYTRLLCQEDGPFWDLGIADEIDDSDGEDESEEEAEESEDGTEYSGEEEEDIVVATSSESDESDSSETDDEERARRERKRERKRARKEKRKRKREQESSDEEEEEEEEEGGD